MQSSVPHDPSPPSPDTEWSAEEVSHYTGEDRAMAAALEADAEKLVALGGDPGPTLDDIFSSRRRPGYDFTYDPCVAELLDDILTETREQSCTIAMRAVLLRAHQIIEQVEKATVAYTDAIPSSEVSEILAGATFDDHLADD